MKELGPLSWFLGMQFILKDDVISINQSLYVKNILSRFNLDMCTPIAEPMDSSVYTMLDQESEYFENPTLYQEIVGSLLYLMTSTRPDICYATTLLSRFMNKPNKIHYRLAINVLKYLSGSTQYDLKYVKGNSLELFGFSDSDYANEMDSVSVSGYAFKLNENSALISWRSAKQKLPATSTTESEYMALHEAVNEALFLRELFGELTAYTTEADRALMGNNDVDRLKDLPPVNIWSDNQGAIQLAQHKTYHRRTKHIGVKFHAVRYYLRNNFIKLLYVPTNDNLADIFTKPLVGTKFKSFSIIRGKHIEENNDCN